MKTNILIILILGLTSSFSFSQIDYFGQTPPGDSAVVFAPGVISIEGRFEECITFSPDGKELAVEITNSGWNSFTIYHCEFNGENWSKLSLADFISGNDNSAPYYTPDYSTFLFTSGRNPRNIFAIDITESGYGDPVKLPSPVSSTSDEWHASMSLNKTLYFHSHRGGGVGESDIYFSVPSNGNYETVENIGLPVNSTAKDADAFISPNEDYIIFNSTRVGGYGHHDLYITYRKEDETWTNPKNLGSKVNSSQRDIWSSVSPDGKYIFFTRRNGTTESDIYWVSSSIIDSLKNTNYTPYVLNNIPNVIDTAGNELSFTIPDTTIFDDDGNETLSYAAHLPNADTLPAWLSFNPEAKTFSGTPTEKQIIRVIVTATDTAGTFTEDDFVIDIKEAVTGISELSGQNVSIFPNPAKNVIQIVADFSIMHETYTISDLSGKVVKQDKLLSNQIDITALKKGIYILVLQTAKGNINKRFVIE